MKQLKLKITGMHCASCAMNIDGELEDTEGIKESNTNFVRAETEVIYDESVIDIEKIQQIISKLGYKSECS